MWLCVNIVHSHVVCLTCSAIALSHSTGNKAVSLYIFGKIFIFLLEVNEISITFYNSIGNLFFT